MLQEEEANKALRVKRREKQRVARQNVSGVKRGFTTYEAAEYIGISEALLRRYRKKSCHEAGPRYIQIGIKVIYLKNHLDEWLNQFPVEGVS